MYAGALWRIPGVGRDCGCSRFTLLIPLARVRALQPRSHAWDCVICSGSEHVHSNRRWSWGGARVHARTLRCLVLTSHGLTYRFHMDLA